MRNSRLAFRNINERLIASIAVLVIVSILGPLSSSTQAATDYTDLLEARQIRHRQSATVGHSGLPTAAGTSVLAAGYSSVDDWSVAVDEDPSRMMQTNPLCLTGSANQVAVFFLDEREGPFGIWGVPVDEFGQPADINRRIAPPSGIGGLGLPAGATISTGDLLIAYPDVDGGGIYVLSSTADLTAQSSAALLSSADPGGKMFFDRPRIAASSSGAIAAWEDYRFGSQIYARALDAAGLPVGSEFPVNEDLSTASRWEPQVAVADGDTAIFVWEDYRSGEPNIYYRVFTTDGTPITGDLIATTDGVSAPQYQPGVVFGQAGGFLLCWIDARSGSPAVYGRLISPAGVPAAPEFVIADAADTAEFWSPALATSGSDQAVVTFESTAAGTVISGRRLFAGAPFGNAFTISDLSAERDRFNPAVAYRTDGGMMAAWTDLRARQFDIRGRSLTINGVVNGDDLLLNDDSIGNQQHLGDAVRVHSTEVIVVYTDESQDEGDVYLQELSVTGEIIADRVKLNDDTRAAHQTSPAIARLDDKTIFTVWTDARPTPAGDQYDIYFQGFPAGGGAAPGNLRLSDDENMAGQVRPDIAAFPGGGAIAVWTDYRLGPAAVYSQVIDETFAREGSNQQIGAASPAPDDTPVRVAAFNLEHSVIAWRSEDQGAGTIWLQWYNRAVGEIGAPIPLDIDSTDFDPGAFDLSPLPVGGFCVAWRGEAEDRAAIFCQDYDSYFNRIGGNQLISGNGVPLSGSVSVSIDDEGYRAYAWTETFGGKPAAVRRVFDPFGAPLDPAEVVSTDAGNSYSLNPVSLATGRYAVTLFDDNRTSGKGYDVRLASYLYSATAVLDDEDDAGVPAAFTLAQNYPNPFNPSTKIGYFLPSAGYYSLIVYDLLGRKVRVLFSGDQPAGPGTAYWDGVDAVGRPVASGIYFYRLQGSEIVSVRKMTLVK